MSTSENNTNTDYVKENYALNTILYGPPGTGKTYNTIKMAAEIIKGEEIKDYKKAKNEFNKGRKEKRIAFVTFHQNYSYEDFIQGIRPKVDDDDGNSNLSFSRVDGVFKRIADRALFSRDKIEKLVLDFANYVEAFLSKNQGKEFALDSGVTIKDVNKKSFVLGGTVNKDKTSEDKQIVLSKQVLIEKYVLDFLIGKIKTDKDIKSRKDSKLEKHGTAEYYIKLLAKIKEYYEQHKKIYNEYIPLQNYVIIIDEINRANISRVFGELITLIEPDKRLGGDIEIFVTLPSGDKDDKFIVPPNLYIIGTMNTADKSIALLDVALRRRFEFKSMYPDEKITGVQESEFLKALNKEIISKKGHDFQIGHAYFMADNQANWDFKKCLKSKVIPLLLEYYRNDEAQVKKLLESVKDKASDSKIVETFSKCKEGMLFSELGKK